MMSLALDRDVMKQSKAAIYVAAALFLVIGAVIYFRPFLETVDAFGTAGGVAADKAVAIAGQTHSTVNRLGQTLVQARAMDSKAIAISLHGVDCLKGSLAGAKACTQ